MNANTTCTGRGTCIPSCELYGYCHCGCGAKQPLATFTHERDNWVKGRPTTFQRGHNQRVNPNYHYARAGMDAHLVLQDLRQLVRVYGSQRKVAKKLGVYQSWVSSALNGKTRRVSLGRATQIAELVRGRRQDISIDFERRRRREEKAYLRRHPREPKFCPDCGCRVLTDYDRCSDCRRRGEYTKEQRQRWATTGYGKELVFDDAKREMA